jgi:hypothetical protein
MTLSLERITDTLPIGFAELEADAKADGHEHVTRLAAEFAQSPAFFHAIFACAASHGIAAQLPSEIKASISLTNSAQAGSSASSAWFSLSSATNLAFGIEAARRRPSSNGISLSRVQ